MCGFVGYIDFSGRPVAEAAFSEMTGLLSHRGPDGEGIQYFKGRPFVALGHRRLAIIDLSDAGRQPMQNEDGSIWILFNGEIFNFSDLRRDLRREGHIFRSFTDTEVIIHAYEEWGEGFLNHLQGMFALVIWDSKKKRIFAARDRLGIKPFYYFHKGRQLILASEIKSIVSSNCIQAEPDWEGLHNPWHYQSVPSTGFKDISKLPPGHSLTFSQNGLRIKKYWDIFPEEKMMDERDAASSLSGILKEVIRSQMIADVPVGAFLSGGLDSSCIVAFMSQCTNLPVRTFTIKFQESDQRFEAMSDDSAYARKVAGLFGCQHQEICIRPDIVNLLPKLVWHLDEPLADPAAINTYLISMAAREAGVKVLLNGMGGDEVFGGYRKHLACLIAEPYRRYLPGPVRGVVENWVNHLPVAGSRNGIRSVRWAKRFLSFASQPQAMRFLLSDQSVPPELYQRLFTNAPSHPYLDLSNVKAHLRFMENGYGHLSYLTRMSLTDTKTFLPDHNLTYSDKATMAAGVEARPPLIDHRVVQFMFGLHPRYRINGRTQKYLFKKSMEPDLPREIIHRPKMHFGAPLRSWIRGPLRQMIDDLLAPNAIRQRGLYDPDAVKEIIEDDRQGRADNAHLILTILNREIWFRTFIDKKPV